MSLDSWIGLACSAAVLVYLVYSLLQPGKFSGSYWPVNGWLQILFYGALLLALTKPLGWYIVRVFDGSIGWLRIIERPIYRVCGVNPDEDQHWTGYAVSVLAFSLVGMLLTYLVLRLQS